ncbi:MAG: hypothetical protein NT038_07340 [Euryarchaeota archaeon]|nr:hypothetical protein [Euryarchaeota archaeon]
MSLFKSDNDRDFFCLENFNSSISACNSRSTSSNLFRITAPSIGITDDNETEAIYKDFPLQARTETDTPVYSLTPLTEVYDRIEQQNESYSFKDEEGNAIPISSITQEQYDGLIYDVDVPNDIVLVRRGNGSAF